jgi:hypothetical protein
MIQVLSRGDRATFLSEPVGGTLLVLASITIGAMAISGFRRPKSDLQAQEAAP